MRRSVANRAEKPSTKICAIRWCARSDSSNQFFVFVLDRKRVNVHMGNYVNNSMQWWTFCNIIYRIDFLINVVLMTEPR